MNPEKKNKAASFRKGHFAASKVSFYFYGQAGCGDFFLPNERNILPPELLIF